MGKRQQNTSTLLSIDEISKDLRKLKIQLGIFYDCLLAGTGKEAKTPSYS